MICMLCGVICAAVSDNRTAFGASSTRGLRTGCLTIAPNDRHDSAVKLALPLLFVCRADETKNRQATEETR
jgi:hypothetical protein